MFFAERISLKYRIAVALAVLALSLVLVLLGFDKKAAAVLLPLGYAGALAAGAFYTLGMTTPLAIIVILDLMRLSDPIATALLASLAAAGVDCLFFSIEGFD